MATKVSRVEPVEGVAGPRDLRRLRCTHSKTAEMLCRRGESDEMCSTLVGGGSADNLDRYPREFVVCAGTRVSKERLLPACGGAFRRLAPADRGGMTGSGAKLEGTSNTLLWRCPSPLSG